MASRQNTSMARRKFVAPNVNQQFPIVHTRSEPISHQNQRPTKSTIRRPSILHSSGMSSKEFDAFSDTQFSHGIENFEENIEDSTVSDKKNLTWSTEMDECLLDSLMEQKAKGQKTGGVFSSTAYKAVSKNVSSKFNILCDSNRVKNRVKTLKKHLGMAKDILQNGSGFGFNFSTNMLEAEAGVWDAYVKGKPAASFLRYTPIPSYEVLDALFGKDRATGSRAVSAKQRQMQWAREQNFLEENEEDALNDEVGKQNNNEESFTSKTEEPKKKKTRMVDVVSEEISLLTASIGDVATAIKLGNQRNYTEEDLFDEIASVGGMSEFSQMTIYQKLTGDVSAARAFHKCPTAQKKLWLRVKFGEEIFDGESA